MAKEATAKKKKAPSKNEEVSIVYESLSNLQRWPHNPKNHDIPSIKASIVRWGMVNPIVKDEKSGMMVAGHGRLDALLEIKADVDAKKVNAVVPRRIRVVGKEWYAPVLCGCDFDSEEEAEAYLIADNRLVEIGGWKQDEQKMILQKFKEKPEYHEPMGYTAREMELILKPPKVPENPETRAVTFMANEIKQIVLYFKGKDYETTLERLNKIMLKQSLKSHTDVFNFLLTKYESNRR